MNSSFEQDIDSLLSGSDMPLLHYRDFNHNRVWANIEKSSGFNSSSYLIKSLRPVIVAVAALAILIMASLFVMRTYTSSSPFQYMHLSDGSEIVLGGNSSISKLYQEGNIRKVDFSGNGHFEIKANPSNPFIIQHQEYSIKVIGTGFTLSTFDQCHRVDVDHGTVILSSSNGKNQRTLEKGESAEICGGIISSALNSNNIFSPITISLNDQPITFLFKELTDNFGLQISFPDSLLASLDECRITTVFKGISVKHIFKELEILHKIKYRIQGNSLVVTEYNCI